MCSILETQLGVSVPQVALESASNRRLELQRGKEWEGRSFRWWWLDFPLRRGFKHLNSHLLWELYLALPTACLCADEVYLWFNSLGS